MVRLNSTSGLKLVNEANKSIGGSSIGYRGGVRCKFIHSPQRRARNCIVICTRVLKHCLLIVAQIVEPIDVDTRRLLNGLYINQNSPFRQNLILMAPA